MDRRQQRGSPPSSIVATFSALFMLEDNPLKKADTAATTTGTTRPARSGSLKT